MFAETNGQRILTEREREHKLMLSTVDLLIKVSCFVKKYRMFAQTIRQGILTERESTVKRTLTEA